ncbi:L-arabinitol 4-dehydrogenase-1 [Elsinoe australis]|uniref:L-arabinitol 4-dehydrogenase-1 n=1 Tax=Elsinoe australis TaxID=40998 RepID=A0A4U7B5A4_9PEZI|nr:L-arabinitol 4-dehydrogenase-1 [Elsinoe australis]
MSPLLNSETAPDAASTTATTTMPSKPTNGTNTTATIPNPPLTTFTPNPALHTNPSHETYLAPSPALNPGPSDCIIHMHSNGICGSDLHLSHAGRIGDLVVRGPHCLGHEGAGRIAWVGSSVSHLKIGDRVAVEPGVPCHAHSCEQCSGGEYNLCPDVEFSGVPPYTGSIRRWHVHDARYLHRLPDGMGYEEGALLEPLSVVLHAFERAHVRLGEPVLVAGAGPIGLIAARAARASGAWPVVVTDLEEERLRFARGFVEGCRTVRVERGMEAREVGERVKEVLRGLGAPMPRVSYECVGMASSVSACLHATRRGGEVMVIGVGKETMDGLPFMHASMAEIDLKFINRYHHSWPYAIRLLQSGYIDLQPLVTHRYKLEEAVEAMKTASDRTKASIKVHIVDEDPYAADVGNGRA